MTNSLSKVMKEKKITKAELSRRLGVKWTTVNNWTKSDSIAPVKMNRIAEALGVPVTDIFKL